MHLRFLVLLAGLLASLTSPGLVSGQRDTINVAVLPPVEPNDSRFGIVQAMHSPQLALNAGASWERIIFPWSLIQKNSANDWNELYFTEQQIRAQQARGIEQVGVLIYTP